MYFKTIELSEESLQLQPTISNVTSFGESSILDRTIQQGTLTGIKLLFITIITPHTCTQAASQFITEYCSVSINQSTNGMLLRMNYRVYVFSYRTFTFVPGEC